MHYVAHPQRVLMLTSSGEVSEVAQALAIASAVLESCKNAPPLEISQENAKSAKEIVDQLRSALG